MIWSSPRMFWVYCKSDQKRKRKTDWKSNKR